MPRRARVTPGGYVYHILDRSVAGLPLFRKEADFEGFERIMIEAHRLHPLPILAWCAMPSDWPLQPLARLGAAREPGDERKGNGGASSMHGEEPALWRKAVANGRGQTARSVAYASQRRSAKGNK